ncbi:hypothetical protein HK100_007898 [Physocladia obscura]|uniref:Uncharacterized protein n=1 Tax=Physocladia obscura TaxID=109957 RepID=A0AAD5T762_9FUNG|nr:hypothetical protein HK100_007898 [Physocladia obscura]
MEQRIEERDKTGKERSRMIGETKLAINNIYDRIISYNNRPSTAPSAIVISDVNGDAQYSHGFLGSGLQTHSAGVSFTVNNAKGGGAGLTVGWANPGDNPLFREGDLSPASLTEKLHFIQEKIQDLQSLLFELISSILLISAQSCTLNSHDAVATLLTGLQIKILGAQSVEMLRISDNIQRSLR